MTVLKIKLKLYAVQNWLKGYRFGWVQRFRCCGHTTPTHHSWCASLAEEADRE